MVCWLRLVSSKRKSGHAAPQWGRARLAFAFLYFRRSKTHGHRCLTPYTASTVALASDPGQSDCPNAAVVRHQSIRILVAGRFHIESRWFATALLVCTAFIFWQTQILELDLIKTG